MELSINFYFEAKDRMKNILFDLLSPTLSSNFVGGEGAFSAEAEPSPALHAGKKNVRSTPAGCRTEDLCNCKVMDQEMNQSIDKKQRETTNLNSPLGNPQVAPQKLAERIVSYRYADPSRAGSACRSQGLRLRSAER